MRRLLTILTMAVLLVVVAPPAGAATAEPGDDDALVVLTGDAFVPSGETVESVVAFDGAVVIDGVVENAVVVFHGPVTITGRVGEAVVVFDGPLTIEAGAVVEGDVVADDRTISPDATVEGTVSSLARFGIGLRWVSLVFAFVIWLSIAVSMLVLGLLLLWLAPRAADAVSTAARTAIGPSIGWGFAVLIGLPILAALAMATVLALPLGLVLIFGLALVFAIGQTAGAWVLGRRILPAAPRVPAFLLGWVIVAGLTLVPVVNGLVWLASTVVGLGAVAVAIFRARREASPSIVAPPIPT
jgi:hypothetical protein